MGAFAVGERPVQLFSRRKTRTAAPEIPTPREPVPSSPEPTAATPAGTAPTPAPLMVPAPTPPAAPPQWHGPDAPTPQTVASADRSGTDGTRAATAVVYLLVPGGSGDGFPCVTVTGLAETSTQTGTGIGGWALLALHGQRRRWSMPLLGRGAALTAPPRVAQAVAVRVLADLGVRVRAWHGVGSADQPLYEAELDVPPSPPPRGPAAADRRVRGHQMRIAASKAGHSQRER